MHAFIYYRQKRDTKSITNIHNNTEVGHPEIKKGKISQKTYGFHLSTSSMMASKSLCAELALLLNTLLFLSSQMKRKMRSIRDRTLGTSLAGHRRDDAIHHGSSSSATKGARLGRPKLENTSNQIIRVKEQPSNRCPTDSDSCRHIGQASLLVRPSLNLRSLVQQRFHAAFKQRT